MTEIEEFWTVMLICSMIALCLKLTWKINKGKKK